MKLIIRCLKSMFSQHVYPSGCGLTMAHISTLVSMPNLLMTGDFLFRQAAPKFPRSNGEAERAVQTAKSILKKEKDQAKALLAYRSTPLACRYSPAQLLMVETFDPQFQTFPAYLKPQLSDVEKLRQWEHESRLQQQVNFNKRHRAVPLGTLSPGTKVHITIHDQPGTVIETAEAPRSYIIETPTKDIRRNREHLVPLEPVPKSPQKSSVVKEPLELTIKTRPKRSIKPSLKALESMASSQLLD